MQSNRSPRTQPTTRSRLDHRLQDQSVRRPTRKTQVALQLALLLRWLRQQQRRLSKRVVIRVRSHRKTNHQRARRATPRLKLLPPPRLEPPLAMRRRRRSHGRGSSGTQLAQTCASPSQPSKCSPSRTNRSNSHQQVVGVPTALSSLASCRWCFRIAWLCLNVRQPYDCFSPSSCCSTSPSCCSTFLIILRMARAVSSLRGMPRPTAYMSARFFQAASESRSAASW